MYDPFSTRASGAAFVRDPFAGNLIPQTRWDAVARNVIKYYPTANQPGR